MIHDIREACDYVEASEICRLALRRFREDINDYLPDYRAQSIIDIMDKDIYLYPWDVDSIQEVYDLFIHAAHSILSTVMSKHISYELHLCDGRFRKAVENKSISEGQAALKDVMRVFGDLMYAIRMLEKSFDSVARDTSFN